VKGFPDQRVIRQTDYDNYHLKPIECPQKHLRFDLQPIRGDFLKVCCDTPAPNDARFDMNENYDRSTYLTKVRRI
jgi:hypothetical protein